MSLDDARVFQGYYNVIACRITQLTYLTLYMEVIPL